jgi:hypothetical protein
VNRVQSRFSYGGIVCGVMSPLPGARLDQDCSDSPRQRGDAGRPNPVGPGRFWRD